MTAQLHLAGVDDAGPVLGLLARADAELGIERDDAAREAAAAPLLAGSAQGAIYIAGMRRAPVGVLSLGFAQSLVNGGVVANLDMIFVRENVRGRGVGTEMLVALIGALSGHGLAGLAVDLPDGFDRMESLLKITRFTAAGATRRHIRAL